jgi:NAD+ kinase
MKVAVYGRIFKPEVAPFIQEMFHELENQGVQIVIFGVFKAFLDHHIVYKNTPTIFENKLDLIDVDAIISIGGDGTLLETVTYVGDLEKPILGINIGRLGFLATISKNDIIKAVKSFVNGYYSVDERHLVSVESETNIFGEANFGLNEFAILKRDTSSMIIVHTYIDGEFLNSYWADGLIISTPTGSTGYSLSCGGPVVLPHSNSFIISPVCPHNLNVRPLIVSAESVLSFEVEGRSKTFLASLDSRSKILDCSVQIAVKKADFKVKLVNIEGSNFLKTLREKLNWGFDVRN